MQKLLQKNEYHGYNNSNSRSYPFSSRKWNFFTMDNFVQGNYIKAVDLGRETLFVTAAITIGIVFITSLSQMIIRIVKYRTILQKHRKK